MTSVITGKNDIGNRGNSPQSNFRQYLQRPIGIVENPTFFKILFRTEL